MTGPFKAICKACEAYRCVWDGCLRCAQCSHDLCREFYAREAEKRRNK